MITEKDYHRYNFLLLLGIFIILLIFLIMVIYLVVRFNNLINNIKDDITTIQRTESLLGDIIMDAKQALPSLFSWLN